MRETLQALSRASGVAETTLFRFFLYRRPYRERHTTGRRFQSDKLYSPTIAKLANALGENAQWIEVGAGASQLAFWPLITPDDVEATEHDPLEPIRLVVQCLEELQDSELQRRAARAAVAAILSESFGAGQVLPLSAYQALAKLDVAHANLKKVASE